MIWNGSRATQNASSLIEILVAVLDFSFEYRREEENDEYEAVPRIDDHEAVLLKKPWANEFNTITNTKEPLVPAIPLRQRPDQEPRLPRFVRAERSVVCPGRTVSHGSIYNSVLINYKVCLSRNVR